MGELKKLTLGDLVNFQRGYDLPKSEFISGTVPVISSNGILGYHNQAKVKAPTITIGRSGTVGYPHYIEEDCFPHNTSLFIENFKDNDPKYIFYLLKKLNLNEYKSGSGVPTMNRNHLHPISILAFDCKQQQQKIASVLSALDAKIELNNKINKELEAMAKTLYDYWFVQFDFPDANGKPYKSSGGKMVYSPELKRDIPEGWAVKFLKDYAFIKKGTLITGDTANLNGKIKVVSAGISFSYYHDKSNYIKNTITISASGANAGFINFWREEIFASDCTVVRGKKDIDTIIILFFLKARQEFLYQQARGSAQPHVYPKDIERLKIEIPPQDIIEKYKQYVLSGNEIIAINQEQNQTLSQIRDFLLPMLMNGQVGVV